MSSFPRPVPKSIIFEDDHLYTCLASHPIARGHVVVVWKKNVADLHLLAPLDYEYLMDMVDVVRNAMRKALHIKKVYLMYMDEAEHVHWHLVPRYNEQGFDVLTHKPKKLTDFSLVKQMRAAVA